jgi:hypothetical protein
MKQRLVVSYCIWFTGLCEIHYVQPQSLLFLDTVRAHSVIRAIILNLKLVLA